MDKEVLWSDETKTELSGHQRLVHTPNALLIVKHGGGSVRLWGRFSSAGSELKELLKS